MVPPTSTINVYGRMAVLSLEGKQVGLKINTMLNSKLKSTGVAWEIKFNQDSSIKINKKVHY